MVQVVDGGDWVLLVAVARRHSVDVSRGINLGNVSWIHVLGKLLLEQERVVGFPLCVASQHRVECQWGLTTMVVV
jgi:hypothetical protein